MDQQEENLGQNEADYEFEYDPMETETFYVDLDLTTANGGRRGQLSKKKLDIQPGNDGEAREITSNSEEALRMSETPASANAQAENDGIDIDAAIQNTPDAAQTPTGNAAQANDIQILDVHGANPMVSYQNQIYHCTWSDMVGTIMFFSKGDAGSEGEDLLSTDDFHLINTSRIKLIGQKARLTAKPGRKRQRQVEEDASDVILAHVDHDESTPMVGGESLGEIRTTNPKTNADIKRQAAFLEKLMDIKRAKGESDSVRTVFGQRKGTNQIITPRNFEAKRSRPNHANPSITEEIDELNRKVVRGDATALIRLQDIYSSMEDDAVTHSLSTTHSTGG